LVRGGVIYVSTNSGASWATFPPAANWNSVASSADGTKAVAVAGTGSIYTSTNSGSSWSAVSGTAGKFWTSVASSANGEKLIAAALNDSIYTSIDSGATWISNNLPHLTWFSVASSVDGNILVAAPGGINLGIGPLFVSTNSGFTWATNNSPVRAWTAVASSADGTKLIATAINGSSTFSNSIYTSLDFGANWISNDVPALLWSAVASSADGKKLVAATYNGGVWTWQSTPTPSLNIAASNQSLKISWIVPSTNFVLQQNSDWSDWMNVTDLPVLNFTNLQKEVIQFPTNAMGIYRLKSF
jgi:hypothetical protein